MKLLLVFCAVVSTIVLANGFSSESEEELDYLDFFTVFDTKKRPPMTDEQKKCIQDGYNGVVDANPDLKWWFDELEATAKKLGEQGQKCKALNGIKKLFCFIRLRVVARIEFFRLVKKLPADKHSILKDIADVVKKCLEN